MNERDGLLREFDDARALLLAAIAGLAEDDFGRPVGEDRWTVEDLLNHVAAWDEVATATVRDLAAGAPPSMREIADVDAWNERAVAPRRGRAPAETLAALHAARDAFRAALEAVPAALWAAEPRTGTGGETRNIPGIARAWARHDAAHGAELRVFRDRAPGGGPQTG